jgi:hypothetical protein
LTEAGRRYRQPVLQVVEQTLASGSKGVSEEAISRTKDVLRHFLINMQEERRGSHE